MDNNGFNITAVERDTGLSKDLLRMWERRYGFPAPARDQHGERVYSITELERLRLIKRLIDKGFRPGKLLALAPPELEQLVLDTGAVGSDQAQRDWEPFLDYLRQGDLASLRNAMQQQLLKQGLQSFVQDTAAPLTVAVGDAWMRGSIRVHEEHAYSEILESLLRQAMVAFAERGWPNLLLTTLPDEEHGLGLLMAEVLFMIEGVRCISLGTRTPMLDIVDAAERHGVNCVAISFSAAFSARQATQQVRELRQLLPAHIELWIGGAGSRNLQMPAGVFSPLDNNSPASLVADWHRRHNQ